MKMPVSQFKAKCTQVLREVAEQGYSVEVTKRGEVVAVVSPPADTAKRDPAAFMGSLRGTATHVGDIISPVAENEWEADQ